MSDLVPARYSGSIWRLLSVAPNRERIVCNFLEERKITAYMPVERLFIGNGIRRRTFERPLVRSYVFARLEYDQQPAVLNLANVRTIIGNSAPETVKRVDKFIAEMQAAEDVGLYDQTIPKSVKLAAGSSVRIVNGKFAGFAGVILKMKPKRRAVLLTNIFGRATNVTLSEDDLELDEAC